MLYRFLIALFALGLAGGGLNSGALPVSTVCQGGYSPRFEITGEVQSPTTYDEDGLGALPHSTENVTFLTKTGPQSGSFQGVLLWDLLNKAGIKSDATRDGQFQYVEVTATDCYQVVLALGEINPGFGGEQVLVADGENGAPLGSDTGFARLIVPGINSEAEMVFGSRASNCFRVLDQVTRVRRIVENGDWRSITRLSGLPSIHI